MQIHNFIIIQLYLGTPAKDHYLVGTHGAVPSKGQRYFLVGTCIGGSIK